MRVIELWTNTPMRFGKGGNLLVSHLREVLPNEARSPQPWHTETGRNPAMCTSLTMQAEAGNVVVRIGEIDGRESLYLVGDVGTALFTAEPYPMFGAGNDTTKALPKREDEPTQDIALQGGASVPGKSEALRKGVRVPR